MYNIKKNKLSKKSKKKLKNKKYNKKSKTIYGGGNETLRVDKDINIGKNVFLSVLNFETCNKDEYANFIKIYNENKENLCIYRHTDKSTGEIKADKTQDLYEFITENLYFTFIKYLKYNIIYLYELIDSKKIILTFILIETKDLQKYNIITLILLCSNNIPNATKKIGDKTIGKYLLDYMYDEYYKVNDSPILFIGHPATPKLIPYYIMWKTPIMSIDFLYLTSGNLLYGNISKISDKTLEYYFRYELGIINSIMIDLDIEELPKDLNSLNDKKLYLIDKAKEIENDQNKEKIIQEINKIKLTSVKEIREILQNQNANPSSNPST